jgi:hypothetical protein
MNIFQSIKKAWKHDLSGVQREDIKELNIGDNIYGVHGKIKDLYSMQNRIYRWFKYAFIVPVLLIGKAIAGRWLVKEVPDKPEYEIMRIVDDSVEESLVTWCDVFSPNVVGAEKERNIGNVKNCLKGGGVRFVRLIKQLGFTGVKHDSAYLELFNITMLTIAKNINNKYRKKSKHLLYVSNNVSDPTYFIAKRVMNQIRIEPVERVTGEGSKPNYVKKRNGGMNNGKKEK